MEYLKMMTYLKMDMCILAAVALSLFLFYFKSWTRSAFLALRLPGPPALPLIGNALLVADSKELVHLGSTCYEKYGRIFRAWISVIPTVFLADPKDVQVILGSNKHVDKNFIYALMHNFIGQGLISNNGSSWKQNRKFIQPYFHMNVLQYYINSFSRSAKQQVAKLENLKIINATTFINDCVLDILHDTILGITFEEKELKDQSPFRKGQMTVPIRIKKPWFLLDSLYKLTSLAEAELKQKSKLQEYTKTIMNKKRNNPLNSNASHKSLLEMFIEISENNPEFSDKDIVNELCTFMLAGQDSVAAGVAFALHYLAKHEDVQTKVVEELDGIFANSDRIADVNDIKRMVYLEQCVKETLRLNPSVPMIARKISSDVTIGKYTIPSGCNVFISPFITHRLAYIYPNPQIFDPDRFSPENVKNLHPYAFIPFSAGPRNCIGYKFALLEMKAILSTILRSFQISPCPGKEFSLLYRITLRAKGGVWLRLKPR